MRGWFLLLLAIGSIPLIFQSTMRLPSKVSMVASLTGEVVFPPGEFVSGGAYSSTDPHGLPTPQLETRGSWLQTDAFTGRYESAWLVPRRQVTVMVAGYPSRPGNRLAIEVRKRDGSGQELPFTGEDPQEEWLPWTVSLPTECQAFRLIAQDGFQEGGGWLAFSQPFASPSFHWNQAWSWLQLLATTCLAVALLYGPGWIWAQSKATARSWMRLLLLGPAVLLAIGVVCWLASSVMDASWLARGLLGAEVLVLALLLWRQPGTPGPPIMPRRYAGALVLLMGFSVAAANVSLGPKGELYGGTISRTLVASGHPDSRISYIVVQLAANGLSPFSHEGRITFAPYFFSSRGPLSGVMAAPIVLAVGAKPRSTPPSQPWSPFDREGFAAYRIVMIVLASMVAVAVYQVALLVAGAAGGALAGALLLLSPFFVHELYFTWPKLIVAAWVLLSFVLAHQRCPGLSGLALGVAYLFHPLAIMSTPFLGVWTLVRSWDQAWSRRIAAGACFSAGVLAIAIAWLLVGRWEAGEYTQSVFLHYWRIADNRLATVATWWLSRWHNFAHTFIPFFLLTADRAHESLNSIYGRTDAWVQTRYLYWNTLPFAVSVPTYCLLLPGIARAAIRRFWLTGVILLFPTLWLVLYWGAADTGLMRHCGHILFVTFLVFGTWALLSSSQDWRRRALVLLIHPAMLAWRALEIAWVTFAPTLREHVPSPGQPYWLNDCLSLAVAAVCLVGATLLVVKETGSALGSGLGRPSELRS